MDTGTKVCILIALTFFAAVGIGLYKQGKCETLCATKNLRCIGTTLMLWGDDFRCICVPDDRVRIKLEE